MQTNHSCQPNDENSGRSASQINEMLHSKATGNSNEICVCVCVCASVSLVAQNISSCHSHTFFIYRTIFGALKRVPFIAAAVDAAAECALFFIIHCFF